MRPQDTWTLATKHVGERVLVFDEVESTNSLAATFAADHAHAGTVILADKQTAGRGQHGRCWQCPNGAGVLMSVVLFPPPALRRAAVLTAWAALSVCETVGGVAKLSSRIKWPNDVYVRDRKISGILIEQGAATIVGIGLNVNQSADDFAAAGLTLAESLASLTGRSFDRDNVARHLIRELDSIYDRLLIGDSNRVEDAWRERINLVNHAGTIECLDQTLTGQVRALHWDYVELELSDGARVRLPPERIKRIEAS